MNKPEGYDDAQAMGDYTPIDLGGHYCIIKGVKETQTKNGKPMIVVCFDFCKPDKQPEYFMQEFKNDTRPDKKWPHTGTAYIMTQDYQDANKTSRNFKTFCTAVEKSNNYAINWGDNWGDQFKGKKIGAVFGEVENEYNGKRSMRHELRWFCQWDKVEGAAVPKAKYLPNSTHAATTTNPDGFMAIPDTADDDVPF